jgi:FemAB-related protein (PEP-CTERM system-associated)
MEIQLLDSYEPECDAFVRSQADAKLCHLQEWNAMIARTLGHTPFYLAARNGTGICGVLPLMLVRSRIFGTRLISQAFSNYGGPVLRHPAALPALLERSMELARQCQCRYLELRATAPLSPQFHVERDKVCMYLPLTTNPQEVWHRLRPEIRNRIRRGEKAGLTVVQGGGDLLGAFYRVWTRRMRQLGTPCYPRQLFADILRSFPQQARIFLVQDNRRTLGACFTYEFHGLAQCRWAGTDVNFNALSPNVLLYWSAIKHYCQAGAQWFDFGRSTKDSSQYEFKRRWGAQTVQLYYQYWSTSGHPVELLRPDNPRYRWKVALWRKLPLCLTRLAGPYLSRSLA